MSNTTVQVRIPKELKQNVKHTFSDMGMTVSEGIRTLLYQTVTEHQRTSIIKSKKTPKGLGKALQEIKDGKSESFESIEDLVASWK